MSSRRNRAMNHTSSSVINIQGGGSEDSDEEAPECCETCNVPLCSSYLLGLLACLLVIGGVCLAFHKWDSLWLLLSGVGVVLILVGSVLHFCGSTQSARQNKTKGRRKKSERHLQEHLLPSPSALTTAYSVSQLSLNMLPAYFQASHSPATTANSDGVSPGNKDTFSQILHIKGQSFLLLPINSAPNSPQNNNRWSTHMPSTPEHLPETPAVKDQVKFDATRPILLTQKDLVPQPQNVEVPSKPSALIASPTFNSPKPTVSSSVQASCDVEIDARESDRSMVDQGIQTVPNNIPQVSDVSVTYNEPSSIGNESANEVIPATIGVAIQAHSPENCDCPNCRSTNDNPSMPVNEPLCNDAELVADLAEPIYDSLPQRNSTTPQPEEHCQTTELQNENFLLDVGGSEGGEVELEASQRPSSDQTTNCDDIIADACSPPPSYEEVTEGLAIQSFGVGYGTI